MCLVLVLLLVCAFPLSAFVQPAQPKFRSVALTDGDSSSISLWILGYASVTATVVSEEGTLVTVKIDKVLSYTPFRWPDILLHEGDTIGIGFGIGRIINLANGDMIKANLRIISAENSLVHTQWECRDEDYFELIARAPVTVAIGAFVAGENSSVDLSENGLPVQGLTFAPAASVENVSFSARVFESRPENVTEPSSIAVLSYLELTTTAPSESISSATINFAVERSWLEENGLAEDAIVLLRWADNGWENLPTTFTRRSETHAFYDAITPGFSVFAITGQVTQLTQPSAIPLWVPIAALVPVVVLLAVIWGHHQGKF